MAIGESWGRTLKADQEIHPRYWTNQPLPDIHAGKSLLPYGLGRSYGDSCLNDGGILIPTASLDRIIHFDRENGTIRAEAGISLADILQVVVPAGWFLPVVPGTKFITLGGAIANDIHGKNHHTAGTFGRHVRGIELQRSDGTSTVCTQTQDTDLLRATIGGLGLTGLILWAEIRLKKIVSSTIVSETIKVKNLDAFLELSASSDKDFEYTVAWLDSQSKSHGKGIFIRGNHSENPKHGLKVHNAPKLPCPMDAPNFMLNPLTVKAFNFAYYNKQLGKEKTATVHYDPFFFPLDAVHDWNRIYGKRGFYQYQFVLPEMKDHQAVRDILDVIARSGQGSFLAVIKTFGEIRSPGLLSFPRPGVTVALDFPNCGNKTMRLFEEMDRIVLKNNGRLYPAKDACMTPRAFTLCYPETKAFLPFVDPAFSSSFWRRVEQEAKS
jgi:FAD/FMN-containing dehydrogenase